MSTIKNTNLPPSVKIGYRTLRLEKLSKVKSQCHAGICKWHDGLLLLAAHKDTQELAATILHELFHAIFCGFSSRKELTEEQEEQAADILSNGLGAVIRDNPELIAWLVHELEGGDEGDE